MEFMLLAYTVTTLWTCKIHIQLSF